MTKTLFKNNVKSQSSIHPRCYTPNFEATGRVVLEKKIFWGLKLVKAPSKLSQEQPRIFICINFVVLESQMLHAKFEGNKPSVFGEE